MTCHYWGRQLPREWVWLSANDFERTGTAVEVALMRSALWGVNVPLPAGTERPTNVADAAVPETIPCGRT